MAETMQSLDQLSALKPAPTPEPPRYVQKLDKQGRAYATGKRKDAVARVWVKPGAGRIVVNTRDFETYFARPVLRMLIRQPLVATNRSSQYDIICTVSGGGLSGQAGAVRHGIRGSAREHVTVFLSGLRRVLDGPPCRSNGRGIRRPEQRSWARARRRSSRCWRRPGGRGLSGDLGSMRRTCVPVKCPNRARTGATRTDRGREPEWA